MDYVYTYMGQRIEELTREELIEALKWSIRETSQVRDMWKSDQDMQKFFRTVGAR